LCARCAPPSATVRPSKHQSLDRRIALLVPATYEPWRTIAMKVRSNVIVVGLYFALKEAKRPYWDWLLANAQALWEQDVILAGDFNTGKPSIDEAGQTSTSSDQQSAFEELGFVDCWRSANPLGGDYTWFSSANNEFRLDYAWASPCMASRVTTIRHDHSARLAAMTDHATVVADLRPQGIG